MTNQELSDELKGILGAAPDPGVIGFLMSLTVVLDDEFKDCRCGSGVAHHSEVLDLAKERVARAAPGEIVKIIKGWHAQKPRNKRVSPTRPAEKQA